MDWTFRGPAAVEIFEEESNTTSIGKRRWEKWDADVRDSTVFGFGFGVRMSTTPIPCLPPTPLLDVLEDEALVRLCYLCSHGLSTVSLRS